MDGLLAPLTRRSATQAGLGGEASMMPFPKRAREIGGTALDGSDTLMIGPETGVIRRKNNARVTIRIRAALFRLADDDTIEYTSDIARGNLLFALRHTQPTSKGPEPIGRGTDMNVFGKYTRETPVLVLHFLNYMLGRMTQKPPRSMPQGPTPAFIIDQLRLLGVVSTAQSTTSAEASNGGCPELAVDVQNYNTQMTDIYAPFVRYCMVLWLIAKYVPVGPNLKYRPLSTSHRDERIEARHATTGQRITHTVAVMPHITSSRYVRANDLLTRVMEEDGIPTLKHAYPIRVGMVFEGAPSFTMSRDLVQTGRGRVLENPAALVHSGAAFDAGKARDYGFINIKPDPAQ